MNRIAFCLVAVGAAPLLAQTPFVFKLPADSKLEYETRQTTVIDFTQDGTKSTISSTVEQTKQWTVVEINSAGEITLELALLRLKIDQVDPAGKTTTFNSEDLAGSAKDLVEQLGKMVNQPIMRVRMTPTGLVKESKNLIKQQAHSADAPFQIALTDDFPKTGLKWKRDYAIALDAPVGQGQSIKARQHCEIESMDDFHMVVKFENKVVDEIKKGDEKVALAQYQPKGTVKLDRKRGILLETQSKIEQQIDDLGGGAKYSFKSAYTERLAPQQQANRRD